MTKAPADDIRYCVGGGSIVGGSQWLPTEPFDYAWCRSNPAIGCNQLRCSQCGEQVMPTREREYAHRYECRCASYTTTTEQALQIGDQYQGLIAWQDPAPGSWACAGHPPLPIPSLIDGLVIRPELLRKVAWLGLALPPFVPPEASIRSFWVSRLYWILPESHRPALADAVTDLLLDEDSRVMIGAIDFCRDHKIARERLREIAFEHSERLATIQDPHNSKFTAQDEVLAAISSRGFQRDESGQLVDPEVHERLCQAVLTGRDPYEFIHTFGRLEPEWLHANAAAIAKNVPSSIGKLVFLLREQPLDRCIAVFRAMVESVPTDRSELYKQINDQFSPEDRVRIRAALEP